MTGAQDLNHSAQGSTTLTGETTHSTPRDAGKHEGEDRGVGDASGALGGRLCGTLVSVVNDPLIQLLTARVWGVRLDPPVPTERP